MMFVSTITEEGVTDHEINYIILNNTSVQNRLIESSLQILKNKGYYGINLYIENISYDNIDSIADYLKRISEIYHSEGYRIVITITPVTSIDTTGINFDKLGYYRLAEYVDGIIFASYEWARTYSFPSSIFPVNLIIELLDYAVNNIPHEKIYLGVTTVGYDLTLPYVPGATGATIITNNSAIQFAANSNTPIQFNVPAQSPYFYYTDSDEILHVVWFKDARSYEARAVLVNEYNLKGLSLWTIMIFNYQLWLIINNQYEIEKPLLVNYVTRKT
ncbi:glycosyl hydrolase family 18 protein [Lacrimispora algidixylanolytica]|uniref:GH18 domain-containing protein n=1 Tax=Lacrimispora algidixylanolytica TaxID=94868 RepID=A0A419T2V3_9FIRM|nr:glycosyl hydrolase family 18 protein [Lacrimispora algidixylanolytica]RKD31738.1 hypothetical protein BET01_19650 [Lacrimispora algidixylanolytica]